MSKLLQVWLGILATVLVVVVSIVLLRPSPEEEYQECMSKTNVGIVKFRNSQAVANEPRYRTCGYPPAGYR